MQNQSLLSQPCDELQCGEYRATAKLTSDDLLLAQALLVLYGAAEMHILFASQVLQQGRRIVEIEQLEAFLRRQSCSIYPVDLSRLYYSAVSSFVMPRR